MQLMTESTISERSKVQGLSDMLLSLMCVVYYPCDKC